MKKTFFKERSESPNSNNDNKETDVFSSSSTEVWFFPIQFSKIKLQLLPRWKIVEQKQNNGRCVARIMKITRLHSLLASDLPFYGAGEVRASACECVSACMCVQCVLVIERASFLKLRWQLEAKVSLIKTRKKYRITICKRQSDVEELNFGLVWFIWLFDYLFGTKT